MFSTTMTKTATIDPDSTAKNAYKNVYAQTTTPAGTEMNYSMIDAMLENEKQQNKNDAWNKLDKTQKTINLHAFAEKYGKEHGLPVKEIKSLKVFFSDCLDKGKLQKTRDVVYNKDTHEIASIPALFFNATTRAFTIKTTDPKRVSTLKSLTPKRASSKKPDETVEPEIDV
jgi:hypothetical protein